VSQVTLVTGGGRSGKSRYALQIAERCERKAFIATAEPSDEEMRRRIEMHRRARGDSYLTIEEPLDPAAAVLSLEGRADVAVLDCLTVWLGNLMHRVEPAGGQYEQVQKLLDVVEEPPLDLVLVTNEVGMGIVPANKMGREFRDLAGRVNQEVARRAANVVLMVSGIPVVVKGTVE